MSDVSFATKAKSDQLNAVDIMAGDIVIQVTKVTVNQSAREQPIWVHYQGDDNKPWKPSKGMVRILATAWGNDSAKWVGQMAQLHFEPTVVYAGKEVGGIQISGLSNIDPNGQSFVIVKSRTQKSTIHVKCLTKSEYPEDKFNAALPKIEEQIKGGKTPDQIIAQMRKTGEPTEDMIQKINALIVVNTSTGEIIDHEQDDAI